jgi:putative copper export protein
LDIVNFVNKWLHLLSISGMLGGILFMRFVAIPAFANGGIDSSEVGQVIRRRYAVLIAILWGVVLVTGFLNFVLVSPNAGKSYHMIVGMKIVLALIMFAITGLLGHPIPSLAKIQEHRDVLLTTLIVIGILVVGISAHLNISRLTGRGLDPKAAPQAPVQPPAQSPIR